MEHTCTHKSEGHLTLTLTLTQCPSLLPLLGPSSPSPSSVPLLSPPPPPPLPPGLPWLL